MLLTADEFQFLQNYKKRDFNENTQYSRSLLNEQHNEQLSATYTTSRGFLIVIDVNGFRPEDFKVTVTRNSVIVSAERINGIGMASGESDDILKRRYAIPPDVLLGSISTIFADSGVLIIKGSRGSDIKTEIPVQIGGSQRVNKAIQPAKGALRQQTIFPADPHRYAICRSFDV